MNQVRLLFQRSLFLALSLLFLGTFLAQAAEQPGDEQALLAKYQSISGKLVKNQFGAPIYIESKEQSGSVKVDMYGVFNYPFDAVKQALQSPPNWCEITFMHINVKACTAKKKGDQWFLTLYNGRKYYQAPSDATPLKFLFRTASMKPDYMDLSLTAKEGPFGTKDHRIRVQAVPMESRKTFLHFSYTYSHGAMARMAIKSYFSTIGRDKVGFSLIRKDGKSYYVGGVRGAIERNTVRYYLALESYIETLKSPENQRLGQRLNRWYDLTAKYRQLKENEKGEYLAAKKKEHANQVALQEKEE